MIRSSGKRGKANPHITVGIKENLSDPGGVLRLGQQDTRPILRGAGTAGQGLVQQFQSLVVADSHRVGGVAKRAAKRWTWRFSR